MREIKFRGKRLERKEWVYGFYTIEPEIINDDDEVIEPEYYMVDGYAVDPKTVGQFTGFTDPDGNEIYEGDILQYGGDLDDYNEVLWNAEIGGFTLRFCDETSDRDLGYLFKGVSFGFYVAGNVYDDPELLSEDDKEGCH